MIFEKTFKQTIALILVGTSLVVASCDTEDSSDMNAESRYRMTTEFTGSNQVLAVTLLEDGSNSLVFKDRINPYEDPFSKEVLEREWIITSEGEFYRITNRGIGGGLSLDIINDGVFDKLTLAPSEDVSGQQWTITTLDNGYCRFTSEFLGPDIALDVTNDTAEPQLTMRTSGNFSGQHWHLRQIGRIGLLDTACNGD